MSSAHAQSHVTPLRIYYGVAGALLFLTFVTVFVAGIDFGPWNMVVAMIVALIKASLVGLFFMHLLYDNKIYAITFLSSLLFLAIFIIFTLFDLGSRDSLYELRAQPVKPHATALFDDTGRLLSAPAAHDTGAMADSAVSDTTDSAAVAPDSAVHE